MTRLAAVVGSVTLPGRLAGAVAGAAQRAQRNGFDVELIDLARVRLDFADGRPPAEHADDSALVVAAIANAEAVLFASPVYRASMTGALKNLLDILPVEALRGKPCGIVAMGGSAHHFLGVEGHLRDVLAWFGALTAPVGVYLQSADFADGRLQPPACAALDELVETLGALAVLARSASLGPTPLAARRS